MPRQPVTNARRAATDLQPMLTRLHELMAEQKQQAFEIGDLVNHLVEQHGQRVKHLAANLGVSRQRLGEYRQTALAFPPDQRRHGLDFHFYTIAARSARKLGIAPKAALAHILEHRLGTTRQATAFLARQVRAHAAVRAGQHSTPVDDDLINRHHHADFRDIVPNLPDASVKLVIADPPYGQYANLDDGHHPTPTASHRKCDNITDADAREVTIDLLRVALPKLAPNGCLILFRPGACADPAWLTDAIATHGYHCHRALTWLKGKVKLGRGDEPYGISTERLLVLSRAGDRLHNHDGSPRTDILTFKPPRPTYATGHTHHLFEKPTDLCAFLIRKHTYPNDLILEPFGGTGPASRAAATLDRRWIYCETHADIYATVSA
ncbi:site-specific DNA-methyltransferase [Phycisphaerales bacterium AB-hyl4]|uniref:site-specific DNA-methyltransferase (adenine-specific) n=1 Tax=Natronomicrosphaera hydrolytica TaxID=3242702 RepID=A0ABV4UA54_9BACT